VAVKGRVAQIAVTALLILAGLWLLFAASGGGTSANAGRVQFYQGPVCVPGGGEEAPAEGCPAQPQRR
jgi:hypothetical protein